MGIPVNTRLVTLLNTLLLSICLSFSMSALADIYPFTVDVDNLSGPFRSTLNEQETGANGIDETERVFRKGSHFYQIGPDLQQNTADDKRIRFWGVNVVLPLMLPATEADAELIAARLENLGFNMARLIGLDRPEFDTNYAPIAHYPDQLAEAPLIGDGSPGNMIRLDMLIGALKQHGIYVDMSLKASHSFVPGRSLTVDTGCDEVADASCIKGIFNDPAHPEYDGNGPGALHPAGNFMDDHSHPMDFFDPAMILQNHAFQTTLLSHVNAFSQCGVDPGCAYKDDPVFAAFEMNNEASMAHAFAGVELSKVPPKYSVVLDGLWNQWLDGLGLNTTADLIARWGDDQPITDSVVDGGFDVPIPTAAFWLSPSGGGTNYGTLTTVAGASGPEGQIAMQEPTEQSYLDAIDKAAWLDQFGWKVKLQQTITDPDTNVATNVVEDGKRYMVTFKARTDAAIPHKITVDVSDRNQSGSTAVRSITEANTITLYLDNAMTEYRACFNSRYTTDDIAVIFKVGYVLDSVYFDDIAFGEAGLGVLPGDEIVAGVESVARPLLADYACSSNAKMTDYKQFIADTEKSFYQGFRQHVQSLTGFNVPMAGSQTTWSSLFSSQVMSDDNATDFADVHSYFGSHKGGTFDWNMDNKSVLEDLDNSFLARFVAGRLLKKPFMITEYNHVATNQYRQESVPMIGAFAAHQDIDGIIYFSYAQTSRSKDSSGNNFPPLPDESTCPPYLPNPRVQNAWCAPELTPNTVMGTLSILGAPRIEALAHLGAHMFRRGDVAASTITAEIGLSDQFVKDSIGDFGAGGNALVELLDNQLLVDGEGDSLDLRTALQHRIGTCHEEVNGCSANSSNFIASPTVDNFSDTGEIEWHEAGSAQGMYMSINTDHSKVTVGVLETIGAKDLGGIVITDLVANGAPDYGRFSTVAITSASNTPILTAPTMLMTNIGRAVSGDGAGNPLIVRQVSSSPDTYYLCNENVGPPCTRAWNDGTGNTGMMVEQTLYGVEYQGAASLLTVQPINDDGLATVPPLTIVPTASGQTFSVGSGQTSPWVQVDALLPASTTLEAENLVSSQGSAVVNSDSVSLSVVGDSFSIDLPATLNSGWYFVQIQARAQDFDGSPVLEGFLEGAGVQAIGSSVIGATIGDNWKGALLQNIPVLISHDTASTLRLRYANTQVAQPLHIDSVVLIPAYTQPDMDADADGVMNGISDGNGLYISLDNCPLVANVTQTDSDSDQIGNACDDDRDGDGLLNTIEVSINTNPDSTDSDGDGLTDGFEVAFGGDASVYEPLLDLNPLLKDTDGDGFNDDVEIASQSDPLNAASTPAVFSSPLFGIAGLIVALTGFLGFGLYRLRGEL